MDALGIVLGLSFLEAMAGDATKDSVPQYIKEMQHQITSSKGSAKLSFANGAKATKQIYDAFIDEGFTEIQAFELLKTVLTTEIRK